MRHDDREDKLRSAISGHQLVDQKDNAPRLCVVDEFEEVDVSDTQGMLVRILRLSSTTMLSNILCFLLQAVAQSYVGRRLGSDVLAHYAIGVTAFNIAGLSIGIGLASALDTLASQAFGRHPHSPEIGQLLQRSLLVSVAVTLPIAYWQVYHAEWVLSLVFGSDLAHGASVFLRHTWLYLPVSTINDCFMKTFQAQNVPDLMVAPTAASVAACWIACHFFVTPEIGIAGASLALTVASVIMFVAFVALCIWHRRVVVRFAAWLPLRSVVANLLDRRAMLDYLEIGVPSLLSLCAEWWAIEVLLVVAAQISVSEVAMLSIAFGVTSMCFSIALGIGHAASVVIGNALGANKPAQAAKYRWVILAVDQCANFITVTSILWNRGTIAELFTSDAALVARFSTVGAVAALFHLCDSTQYTLQGIFRGAGKQQESAAAVLMSLWLLGVPMSAYLGIARGLGTPGILCGLMLGFGVEIPLLLMWMLRWDWMAMAEAASREAAAPDVHGGQKPLEAVGDAEISGASPRTEAHPLLSRQKMIATYNST